MREDGSQEGTIQNVEWLGMVIGDSIILLLICCWCCWRFCWRSVPDANRPDDISRSVSSTTTISLSGDVNGGQDQVITEDKELKEIKASQESNQSYGSERSYSGERSDSRYDSRRNLEQSFDDSRNSLRQSRSRSYSDPSRHPPGFVSSQERSIDSHSRSCSASLSRSPSESRASYHSKRSRSASYSPRVFSENDSQSQSQSQSRSYSDSSHFSESAQETIHYPHFMSRSPRSRALTIDTSDDLDAWGNPPLAPLPSPL